MLNIVKRLLKLADNYAKNLKIAFVISIFEGMFSKVPIMVVLYVIVKMHRNAITIRDAWISGIAIITSVIITALLRRIVDHFQSGTGYEIFERERMKIGDRLKRLPMGYFSEGNIGNVMAVITSDLVFIEEHSIRTLSKIVTGYINMIIGVIMLMFVDIRLSIITIITLIVSVVMLNKLQKVSVRNSELRQWTQSRLVSSVLEYVKGITVIKSFNMTGEKGDKINREFKKYRDVSIDFEKELVPSLRNFENCFAIATGVIVFITAYFTLNGELDMSFMLAMLIFVFQLFLPFKVLGDVSAIVRIMETCLDRYDLIINEKIIDEDARDITLNSYDVEFKNVSFAYEKENILHDISFKVPQNTMTALVGKSGCGKTTIANLVARFWDVQKGTVSIGEKDVKEMTCDSLLRNISMVFQNVYLFNDTVINNVKFGKPDATKQEIIQACKKARCHDFIMKLDNGYDTVVGEGGSSLSGGEKQRISIARAILKDAPIILLDEATASVDPDNEKHIQKAINELVKDKTLIVIAHRLSTIKNADQILVIDNGKIMQSGTHEKLIDKNGQYQDFWKRRTKARSWKISKIAN
ncbi:ABC transporter ATP-binding protein [Clostridiaceae bacterium M8S5]|nr:ABC transporter ATP-binding protein [Clostridiaceae bacterium M8S5]